jgi:hypothetical protein
MPPTAKPVDAETPMSQTWPWILVRVLVTLVLATVAWAVIGFFATAPLGAIYGWGGHPAAPSAPMSVYIGLYLVVLPIVCLAGTWFAVGAIARLFARRR